MVAMQATFGSPDIVTPHGGTPFQAWRKGFGFGHGKGPGNFVNDPSLPLKLKHGPRGDRSLASGAFWRKKWELGQASSFGIGDRPDYGNARDADIAPNTYGDVSPLLSKVKRNVTRAGINLQPRFPTIEEKYRDLSWPKCGPGPAKYNTCIPTGQSSWSNPARNPSYTMQPRSMMNSEILESMRKPGPPEYPTRTPCGKNSPIKHGTLYDIALKGRTKVFDVGANSPGPAKYDVKSPMDLCGYSSRVSSIKVPKSKFKPDESSMSVLRSTEDDTLFGEQSGDIDETEDGRQEGGNGGRGLTRVESSPI
mmetsp:Transcript_82236/g.148395  ORF Transcript_82236/g.148395 Transcript_82236/m.148395 type:complete len:308 (+) Transcript_82236:87-1010(+)